MTTRQRLDKMMVKLGYPELTKKSDEEVLEGIETNFMPMKDIDVDEPFELIIEELKDIFYEKHWITLNTLITDEDLRTLYEILLEYK